MGKHKASLPGQLANIDLKLLRIFKAVVDCGGITAAEAELNIATSTISNYLTDLEQRLNMRLCLRGRRGFSLTEHGATVYSAIQELLTAIEQFQSRIRDSKERLIGSLHLGIAEGYSSYRDSPVQATLNRFTCEAPEVYVDLHMLLAEEVPRAVMDERLSVGIGNLTKPVPGLDVIPLNQEHLMLYCGRQHPFYQRHDSDITEEEIEQQKFVETPRLKPGQELRPQAERWYMQACASYSEARALLIQTGNFLCYLPQEYVAVMGLEDSMRPLLPEQFNYTNTYYAMTRKNAYLSPVTERFLDCLNP